MGLPDGITTITVTGTYVNPDGSPAAGSVIFQPSSAVTDAAGMVIIPAAPVQAGLGDGSFSVILPCTDNEDLQPAGWVWRIAVAVPGIAGAMSAFSVLLPHTLGSSVDITALSPVAGTVSGGYSLLSANNTWTGSNIYLGQVTLTGSPVAPTADPGTDTTQIATTAFVTEAAATAQANAEAASVPLASVGAADGVASLGDDGIVPDAQLPPVLTLVASTGTAGYTLVNGTGTILSWTAPADGQMHRFQAFGNTLVTSAETGGVISVTYTPPGGTQRSVQMDAAGHAAGEFGWTFNAGMVAAGSTVALVQSSALTGGAAIALGDLWAS